MISDIRSTELVREALTRLYDPRGLVATELAAELDRRGLLRSPHGLFDYLIDAIERLQPPDSAPLRSHSWSCYWYLRRRYVDCHSHASIASELGISVRQASRIHQDALTILGEILFSPAPFPELKNIATSALARTSSEVAPRSRLATPGPESSLRTELSLIAGQQSDGPIDMVEVVTSVFETIGRMADARHLQLSAEIPDHLPAVRIARVSLRQMLLNAALYLMGPPPGPAGSSGSSQLSVSVRADGTGETVSITLERVGPRATLGVDPPHAKTMDSLFAAVKQLSRQQKCEAALVVSTPSQITVRLTIPTKESVRTVLVLDDNPDVGELLQRMLTGCDYQVTHVRTASRAVKIARETQPSVILLDVVLPVLDGWEVLAVLLAEPLTSHIPVVVCSVLPDRELALSLGAADFLSKPIARPILSQTLARVLSSPIVGESVSDKH